MKDPYAVLGVGKSANQTEVKSAFRKLAKKLHPDQNPNDPKAKTRFAEINQAYEILGDKEKRGQFDRGEIDGEGKPKFAGFGGPGGPFGRGGADPRGGPGVGRGQSPFGNMGAGGPGAEFGGNAEDILGEFFGSAFGTSGGAGRSPGGGFQQRTQRPRPAADTKVKVAVSLDDLARGKANVTLPDGSRITASIPRGAKDGQTIRIAGKGKPSPGQKAGDVLATLVFKPDARFKVEGSDLRGEVSVPLDIAVLGGSVFVETLDGKISLKIPAWTNSGKVFRLKGRGLPKKHGHGDLMIVSSIKLPEKQNDALIALMKQLKADDKV